MNALPLVLSVLALIIWSFAFAGIADHWRRRRAVPSAVIAALLIAVVGSVVSRLLSAPAYLEPGMDIFTLGAHIQRALLVTTGVYALVALIASRWRW